MVLTATPPFQAANHTTLVFENAPGPNSVGIGTCSYLGKFQTDFMDACKLLVLWPSILPSHGSFEYTWVLETLTKDDAGNRTPTKEKRPT